MERTIQMQLSAHMAGRSLINTPTPTPVRPGLGVLVYAARLIGFVFVGYTADLMLI